MTSEQLTQVLSEAGKVVDVYIPTDRATGRPRGFAFATFSSEAEAVEAIKLFHQREIGGRRLNVNQAEDRPRRPPGPGGFGAGGGDRSGGPPRRFGPGGPGPGGGGFGGGGFGGPRGGVIAPPPEENPFGFEGKSYSGGDDDDGGRRFKGKGSRRGLRARKRSL